MSGGTGDLERETRLQAALLDNIPGCVALILKNGVREIVASNGLAREQGAVIGETCFRACMGRDSLCPFCLAPELWATGKPQQVEVEREGRWYEAIWAPLSEDLYVHYIFDITHRKQAEEALRRSEERHRLLADNAGDVIWTMDADCRFTYVSPSVAKLRGYSVDEVMQQSIDQALTPESATVACAAIATATEALRAGRPCPEFHGELEQPCKDGSTVWTDVTVSGLLDSAGEFAGFLGVTRDVSERKRMEQAFRLTQFSVDRAADLITWIDSDGRILYANQASCLRSGYSPDELLSMTVFDLDPSLTPEIWRETWRVQREAGSFTVETVHRTKGGETYPLEIAASCVELDGREYGCVFARDIGERKRAEEQLAKSERHFRSLIEQAADTIYVITRDQGRIVACNEQACKDTGYTREELLGMCTSDIEVKVAARDVDALHFSLSPGVSLTAEGVHRRKDGSTFPVEIRFALIEEGEPQLVLSIVRDTTDRKRSDEALQAAKEYAERLIQTANAMILGLDLEGKVILVNDATVAVTGYSREELLGQSWSSVLPEESSPKTWETFDRLVNGQDARRHENPIITKSGELRHIIWQNNVVREQGEIVSTISFGIDITDRMRAEEALRQSEEQLRQSQKMEAIGQLAGGIAHDFNNLLTAIIGYSDLLLGEGQMQSLSPREDVQEIKHAAERAAALTRQILAFSRRQTLRPVLVSLNETLVGMEHLLRRTLGEDVELVSVLQPDLGPAEVDVNQFEQVVMNLAVNARDAMPVGGRLTLHTANVALSKKFCRLHPGVEPGPYVMLSVSDTGVGMDGETMSRIFEPFFTTKAPGEGTGLGLSTAYGIVQQSGGTIEVQSELGHGSSFKVYLPLAAVREADAPDAAGVVGSASSSATILVVEDEGSLRILATRILERRGYTVLSAANADEALELLSRSTHVDLLLTDVVLSGSLHGNDLARLATSLRQDLPVLYMSGYPRDAIVHAGRLDEGVNYLEKPFTPDGLALRVGEVLSQARASG